MITLLDVGGLISWHVVIGTLLIPPALLKTASTGWRIARYYSGTPPYRQAGPPPMLLRILGPVSSPSPSGCSPRVCTQFCKESLVTSTAERRAQPC